MLTLTDRLLVQILRLVILYVRAEVDTRCAVRGQNVSERISLAPAMMQEIGRSEELIREATRG